MPGILDLLPQVLKYLPEIHRLLPLLERIASPQARQEMQQRVGQAAQAATDARHAAEQMRDAVTASMTQIARQNADLQSRLEACEQRIRDASTDLRTAAQQQEALTRQVAGVLLWARASAAVGVIAVLLLIVLLVRH